MEGLIILAILFLVIGPILAVVALVQTSSLASKVRALQSELAQLSAGQDAKPVQPPSPAGMKQVEQQAQTKQEEPEALLAVSAKPDAQDSSKASAEAARPPSHNVEQALASRWLVWLGGAAIAIGGLLFIKYAHDNGLIPPIIRVLIGWIAGLALIGTGEWLRRKRGEDVKDFVPAALSASGLVIAFGTTYSAYALYNLFAPAVCFPILAAISLAALWLATRQGQLIAALGLVGATFSPALVPSDNPSTSGFFAYLLVIVVASLWLLRKLNWWWLGYAAVAAGLGWSLLWITGYGISPNLPIGIFALALSAAATLLPRGKTILQGTMGNLLNPQSISPPMGVAIAGISAGAIILSALTIQSGHTTVPLIMFAIGMATIVAFGWMRDGLVAAPLLAALAAFGVLLSWHDVGFHTLAFDEQGFWTTVPGLIEPPRFRNTMLVALVAFTATGLVGTLRKTEKRPWAALASAAAFLFLFGTWARADFTLSWQVWVGLAVALAAALSFLGWKTLLDIENASSTRAVEFFAAGTALLGCFALDRALDGVWQTLAIAAFATAMVFVTRNVNVPNIAGIASAVASFAVIRLFAGREFWNEPQDLPLGRYWIVYGYGVPAALFWQASKYLQRDGFTRWRVAFEGISLGLMVSLASLLLRTWIGGAITHDGMTMLEWAAHACVWLGTANGLAYRQHLYSTFVSKWGARILLAASTAALFILLTVRNPVLSGDAVEGGQVFNAIWLAYFIPVPLLAMLARKLDSLGWPKLRSATGVFALMLLMTFVTLLVKRQFQGPVLDLEFLSQPESYAVSLAWLVTGIGIFLAGIKLNRQAIRYGGLAILVLTVLKVFGYDVFSLGGLWRIASVIGLGLCLVGVGWLYTRFIGQPAAQKPDAVS